MVTAPSTPPPIPNSYWVRPGQLLAGEYPGAVSRTEAVERVRKLLQAGITSFVDLTEEGELPPYDQLLPELTEQQVRYRRVPIIDHGLPESPADMVRILDLIDREIAAGRCVYVHCRAGIGRTGTTMGCYLIRSSGLSCHDALAQLQELWRQCGRAQRWPSIPETDEQVDYVLSWHEAVRKSAGGIDLSSRYEAALVGLALGDALGTLVANSRFDAATLAAGAAVRDAGTLVSGASSAMTRAVAESLLAKTKHDPDDQMQRYLAWSRSVGTIAVPAEVRRALAAWQWSRKRLAGSHDPTNLDPHSLPRTLAVALYKRADAAAAIEMGAEVSRTTQQSPVVLDLCRVWTALFVDALSAVRKETLLAFAGPAMQLVRQRTLKLPVANLIERGMRGDCSNAEDALSVTCVALDGFGAARTLREALLRVETSSRAAPAAAALCGALCGACYGVEAIDPQWRRQLPEDAALRSLARHLLT